MFIRSERLFLRPGWPEDWNELFGQIADKAVVRNLSAYMAEAARAGGDMRAAPRHPQFLVTLPHADGSRLIGSIGLAPFEHGTELACWIVPDLWNRGYATEAVRAVLSLARTLGHRRIAANVFLDDPAWGRVLRKAGFCPTGEIAPRFAQARGCEAPAALHAVILDEPCEGDAPDQPEMRAA